ASHSAGFLEPARYYQYYSLSNIVFQLRINARQHSRYCSLHSCSSRLKLRRRPVHRTNTGMRTFLLHLPTEGISCQRSCHYESALNRPLPEPICSSAFLTVGSYPCISVEWSGLPQFGLEVLQRGHGEEFPVFPRETISGRLVIVRIQRFSSFIALDNQVRLFISA